MNRRDLIDWDEALRLEAEGWSYPEIARRLRCGRTSISRGLRERGVDRLRVWKSKRRRHGTKLYGLWVFLRRRCEEPAHPGYPRYGAKGIRIARAWQDFDAFYEWAISAGYAPGMHLERIRPGRSYTPANCRWVGFSELRAVRSRPQRAKFLVRAFGERKGQAEWARDPRCRVGQPALRDRLAAGWPPEEAISAPPGSKPTRIVRPPEELLRKRRPRARIDWDEARRLYRREELSEDEIARRYGATRDAIVRGFQRYGVSRRRRAATTLDLERARLLVVWQNLRRRSERQTGRRRVRVAPEWREFEPFLAWARASGAKKGLWLARKNARWGFSPGNCEWVSREEATRRRLARS